MSTVFFGSPQFAVPTLEALVASGEKVLAVVTRKDKRRGRGGGHSPCAVKEAARAHGIDVLEPELLPELLEDEGFLTRLRGLKPEFLVVAAYGKFLPQAVLALPSISPVNLHPSLLPRYRGASPIAWAVINGDMETGVSTMQLTGELDAGDVYMQEGLPITYEDTTETLSRKLSTLGAKLMVKTLEGLRSGTLKGRPQEGASDYARMLKKDDGHIRWDMQPVDIFNLVRGTQPWPGAFLDLSGKRLKVLKVRVDTMGNNVSDSNSTPGTVVSVGRNSFSIAAAGGGAVQVLKVQPEGKKAMPTGEFLLGHEIKKGQRAQ